MQGGEYSVLEPQRQEHVTVLRRGFFSHLGYSSRRWGLNRQLQRRKRSRRKRSKRSLCKTMKGDILGDKVEKVVVSDRSLDCPCGLVSGEYGEELKDQAGKKTMEINPDNDIMELREIAETDKYDEPTKELVLLLFETALFTYGFSIDEPKQFTSRIHRMLIVEAGHNGV